MAATAKPSILNAYVSESSPSHGSAGWNGRIWYRILHLVSHGFQHGGGSHSMLFALLPPAAAPFDPALRAADVGGLMAEAGPFFAPLSLLTSVAFFWKNGMKAAIFLFFLFLFSAGPPVSTSVFVSE